MYVLSFYQKKIVEYVHLVFMFIILYFLTRRHYILLHTTAEIVTVVFGAILMLIALSTIKISENKYLQFLTFVFSIFGITSLFFDDYNENFPVYILLEYYECILLYLSTRYMKKKLSWNKILIKNIMLLILFGLSVIVFKNLQEDYIKKYNLISFYHFSAFVFALVFFIFLIQVIRSEDSIISNYKSGFTAAILFKIFSCLFFILPSSFNGKFNVLGHIAMNITYYYIFIIMLKEKLIDPYDRMFKKLNNKAEELESVNEKLDKVKNKVQSMEELNEKFINLIPDGILIIKNKKIQSANDRFLNMFEIEDGKELVNVSFTEIIDSSYHQIFEARINNFDRSTLEKPQEYKFVWGNKKKWVETTSLISNNDDGEYIISAIRNIEDRKKAEEAEKLLEMKSKEENLKNDFFANISHELRTPINVIYSALQVQNEYLKTENVKGPIVKYNKIIKQNSLRLMRLINNIIDITRIESSFFKPNYKIENIISIVEDVTMSIVEYIKSKNIDLTFDTEVEEAYVKCDSDLIERIMLNLLSNAVKYGREGGNIYVNINKNSENNIQISVEDDGIGIPNEMKEKVFSRFLKVDNSLSRKTEGSGIGLSLVKELVEMHKGVIICDSELNVGTKFKIIFPTVEASLDLLQNERQNNYSSNAIEPAEIEFSDIYN